MSIVVETTEENKIKRVYTTKIHSNKTSDVRKILDKYVQKGSTVITDGNKSYSGYMIQDYNIIKDIKWMKNIGNPVNRMVQQIKSWLRGVYHKSTHQHIQTYMDAFSFRINRSLWKEDRFHVLIIKGLNHSILTKRMIPDHKCFV